MQQNDKILILCREYDKYQGREPIVYDTCIPENEITNRTLQILGLRSRYNSELAYFLVLESHWKENEEQIKKDILNEHKFDEFECFIGSGDKSVLESRGILRIH